MGSAHSSRPSTSDGSSVGSPMVLNVYDLTPLNDYMVWFGIGIFHSGIEVHGLEYGFGAHDFPTSGVFEVEPRLCPGFVYRCSIPLGHVNMNPLEFRAFMEDIAEDYHGDTYQVISKNCNHFTDDICLRLTGRPIPGWVNRLAHLGVMCSCLLPESFRQPAVKQIREYRSLSEDGLGSFLTVASHDLAESDDIDQEKELLSTLSAAELACTRLVQRSSSSPNSSV